MLTCCSAVLVGLCLELFLQLLEEGVKSVPYRADDDSLSQIRQMKRISWEKVPGVLSSIFMVRVNKEVIVLLDHQSRLYEVALLFHLAQIKHQGPP